MRPVLSITLAVFLLGSNSCSRPEPGNDGHIILGIFGGMGPEATADLYRDIIAITPAEKDQDHIPTLIYSLPQVPDRMASIRTNDGRITPYLVEGVTRLEQSGASFIAIPCNTVHYFYEEMQQAVSIPIIHMIKATSLEVARVYPQVRKVGLLATTGTIESKLYEGVLEKMGFEVIVPDDSIEHHKVMKAVEGIKAKTDPQLNEDLLFEAAEHLVNKGAELLVLGCTEIPLAFNPRRTEVPVVNATRVLAETAVRMYDSLSAHSRSFRSGPN